uniref:BPI fold-containing family A member 1 n=1 Tax=Rhinolophus ferrumequinum TaxID=59479 RepID=A0A671EIZ9_RHIFE
MFHIGGLIVLCGLLAQTMPSTPTAEDENPKGLLGSLKGALSNGLVSENVLSSIKELPLVNILKNQTGLLGKLPSLLNIFDLEITDARLMELGLVQSPDGHRLYASFPLDLLFIMKLPLIGNIIEVNVDLNITGEILAERNEAGNIHLVVGDCSHSPSTIKVTLLNGKALRLVQAFINTLTGVFTNVLPALVQSQVCPLINTALSHLDVTVAHDIANRLIQGLDFVITV